MILRISFFSSAVSSTVLDAQFSSSRLAFVVPGIGIKPWEATHASAI